ncbi:hypothetical protein VVD49_08535 [Uliginosibacterium sp. H3]|uniref:Ribbon-helix-helix protein, CopG family n=1 Tax=Uliginosibacterium silvisoli TaxID=3114758 RepID=A0ABU6K3Y4_9RHOO|nr:hypothetical protein [Uliginosibacterium sp. H3]
MQEHEVVLKLNQQQRELLERTVEKGVATDKTELVRLALREYAEMHAAGRITQGYAGALK